MRRYVRACLLICCASGAVCAQQKNVLLLIGDDHGLELGCYGNPVIQTPNLDRLASQGVRFENAFCTTSSCSPSRSVLFTGMHNHSNGQYGLAHSEHNFHMRAGVQTMVEVLHEAGYRTGLLGKFHVEPANRFPFDELPKVNGRDVARMAELAESFFRQSKEKPFLLILGFIDPHRDFGNKIRHQGVDEVKYSPQEVLVPRHLPDTAEVREELAEYYQSVSRLDQGVGKVLMALDASGRAPETLVIYLSDNGMPFPGAKTTVYEPGIHLPLIVRAPGMSKSGLVNKAMVSWVDIAPTIVDWGKGDDGRRPSMHGRSLLSILGQPDPKGWDEVYCSHSFHEVTMSYPMRAVRTRTHKLIWNLRPEVPFPFASDLYGSKTWQAVLARNIEQYGARPTAGFVYRPTFELYDLTHDPDEAKNLADDPAAAEVKAELKTKLDVFLRKTKDPWLEMVEQKRVPRPKE